MEPILSAPCTPAQRQRDVLLGALVGLARSTVNETTAWPPGGARRRTPTLPRKHWPG